MSNSSPGHAKFGAVISQVISGPKDTSLPAIIIPEPRACMIKYFIPDSVSREAPLYTKIGIKPIRLISSPAQILSQCKEDKDKTVPKVKIDINKNPNGIKENILRERTELSRPKQS